MSTELDPSASTTAVYDAAADAFDHPVLTFWESAGRGTVDALDLGPGMDVLDVASGWDRPRWPPLRRWGRAGAWSRRTSR